jgi:flagellin-specific chaperone FliS
MRIDVILGLYDQALERIRQAQDALRDADAVRASGCIAKAELAVSGLVCGVQGHADAVSQNFLRLYDFVTRNLRAKDVKSLAAATQVLMTLREGFSSVREEAQRLERDGVIPPMDRTSTAQLTA